MMALKQYTVVIGGIEHTMQLSDEDAKRYGDAAKPASKATRPADKAAEKPADKSRTVKDK